MIRRVRSASHVRRPRIEPQPGSRRVGCDCDRAALRDPVRGEHRADDGVEPRLGLLVIAGPDESIDRAFVGLEQAGEHLAAEEAGGSAEQRPCLVSAHRTA